MIYQIHLKVICQDKLEAYGIKSLPAIAFDGKLLPQYINRGISDSELSSAGIGSRFETAEYSVN